MSAASSSSRATTRATRSRSARRRWASPSTGRSRDTRGWSTRGADGITRPIEATAFPLLAHTEELVGAIAIFWERAEVCEMRARIWGSRGSIATPVSETTRYGGNTSCIEVRLDDGTLLILDAGTGARGLGVALLEDPPARIDLLLTHLHVDHVEGLGAFEPIWRPQTDLHIWGPASPSYLSRRTDRPYLSPPLFPIHVSDVPARSRSTTCLTTRGRWPASDSDAARWRTLVRPSAPDRGRWQGHRVHPRP